MLRVGLAGEPVKDRSAADLVVKAHFGRHPDAEISLSQPGLGSILGARVLARVRGRSPPLRRRPQELRRHHPRSPAKPARKRPCTPGTCTTTGSSTRSLDGQAQSALRVSPGALWVPNRSSMSWDLGVFVDQSAESIAMSEAKLGW